MMQPANLTVLKTTSYFTHEHLIGMKIKSNKLIDMKLRKLSRFASKLMLQSIVYPFYTSWDVWLWSSKRKLQVFIRWFDILRKVLVDIFPHVSSAFSLFSWFQVQFFWHHIRWDKILILTILELSNFVSPSLELHNQYYHNLRLNYFRLSFSTFEKSLLSLIV